MDEWGRGPWFDPNASEPTDPDETPTQQQQQRSTGGPRSTDGPTPGGRVPSGSAPLRQRLGPDDEQGDPATPADAPGVAPSSAQPAEGRGMRPRPTLSRPLFPPEPWNASAGPPAGGIGPLSRPAWDDAPPAAQGASGASRAGSAGGEEGKQRRPARGRRRGRSVIALLLLLLMVALLVGSIGFVLTNSPFTSSLASGPTATETPTVMGTPTDTPSPTPIPPPTAATVSFAAATQQLSSAGSMTSCPSGCDLTGNSYSHAQHASDSSFPATQEPQSSLSGIIHAQNKSTTQDWHATNYAFSGGGYTCAPQTIALLKNTSNDFVCFISASTPSSISAHTIEATASSNPLVTFTQPNALTGNGYYIVLQSDCDSAYSSVEAPYDQTWANNWMASQSVPSGWKVALAQPKLSFTNTSCPVNQQQSTAFTFTASVTANVNDAAYNPSAAQSVAAGRRDGLLPAGYLWQAGTRSTCSPSVSGVASNDKVTLSCADSGTAYFNWTSDRKANLAASVAGQLKTAALDICSQHTSGVLANSCSISITGGDGTVLPVSANVITIQVKGP